jgi:hypothetical protein
VKLTTLSAGIFLSGCAAGRYDFIDHTALVLRPSHKQALLAYSFGGGEAARRDNAGDSRTVAASLAAAMTVDNNPLPSINTDTMDFKGGRVYLHTSRNR